MKRTTALGNGLSTDDFCPLVLTTGHLHPKGSQTEQQQARETRANAHRLRDLCEAMPTLDYRVDLNLKRSVAKEVRTDVLMRVPGATTPGGLIRRDGSRVIRSVPNAAAIRGTTTRYQTRLERRYLAPGVIDRTAKNFMTQLNRMLRKHCPRGYRRHLHVDAIGFFERGTSTGNPHFHFLIERPWFVTDAQFIDLVERAWHAQEFASAHEYIGPIDHRLASLSYNTKRPDAWHQQVYVQCDPGAPWRAVNSARDVAQPSVQQIARQEPEHSTPAETHPTVTSNSNRESDDWRHGGPGADSFESSADATVRRVFDAALHTSTQDSRLAAQRAAP